MSVREGTGGTIIKGLAFKPLNLAIRSKLTMKLEAGYLLDQFGLNGYRTIFEFGTLMRILNHESRSSGIIL